MTDNRTVEVKLQAPWFIKHWLTFGSNQESKLRNVDQLYVIGYNNTHRKCFNWANKIWYIKNSFQKISYTNPKTGKSMFAISAISLYDPAVFEVADTLDEIVKMYTKYTTSTFK
jgi:hypothetical protein